MEFGLPMYTYVENVGVVSDIEVRLSHEIAQELEVFYTGGTRVMKS